MQPEITDETFTVKEELDVRRAFSHTRIPAPDVDREWDRWVQENVEKQPESHARQYFLVALAAAAAVALLFVLTNHFLHPAYNGNEVFTASTDDRDVTVTDDHGETQIVKTRTLAFRQKPAERRAKMITVATPNGKDFKLTLPDGTLVSLNANSRIQFPEVFTGRERHVRINGEAYLEVKHDPRHPFIAETDFFTTTVLGTVFNVRAYTVRDASLVLVSGRVSIKDNQNRNQKTLYPGEIATWTNDGRFNVSAVDTYPLTQWKDGYFYFNNTPMVNMMQELGRWYNVSVVFEDPQSMKIRLHFIAEHKEPLNEIIRRINDLGLVKIYQENGVVTVK